MTPTTRTISILILSAAPLLACTTHTAKVSRESTRPDGTGSRTLATMSTTTISKEAAETVGDLATLAAPFLPPGITDAAKLALAGLAGWAGKGTLARRREDRLYDEAYDRGRGDAPRKQRARS